MRNSRKQNWHYKHSERGFGGGGGLEQLLVCGVMAGEPRAGCRDTT